MNLVDWRKHHGISARAAASLFGAASAANMIRIENGETWTGPVIATRIATITASMGPAIVTPDDLLIAWRSFHPQESRDAVSSARQAVRGFNSQTQKREK